MADYKDIISGTINSIVGKVKEVAESGAVRDIYENGANRAKSYGRIAKLALELNGENEELKRVSMGLPDFFIKTIKEKQDGQWNIGRLYYEQAKDAPEGFFAPLFAQAEEICGRIAAKEDEINSLKADVAAATGCDEADIDVEIGEFDDFDNIVDATEDDGKNE